MLSTNSYAERDALVILLGYLSYTDYLNSELWYLIKKRLRKERGDQCTFCTNPALEYHHVNYTLNCLSGTDLSSIIPVCRICHMLIEYDAAGCKRNLEEAQEAYQKMVRGAKLRG